MSAAGDKDFTQLLRTHLETVTGPVLELAKGITPATRDAVEAAQAAAVKKLVALSTVLDDAYVALARVEDAVYDVDHRTRRERLVKTMREGTQKLVGEIDACIKDLESAGDSEAKR